MRRCPQCKDGFLRQQGFDSCNWVCDLCGYKEYRAKPRIHVSRYNSDMNAASSKMRAQEARMRETSRALDQASRDLSNALKEERAARKAARESKKKSGFETFIAVLFFLWLLSKLM